MTKKFPLNAKGFHPYGELIGLTFTKFEKGFSQCTIKIEKKLMNPHGFLHGGIIYSMADTGMGAALYSLLEENESCATVEVKISYFKPVIDGVLICNTKVINKGRTISALESEITNNEKLIAKASGTFSIFPLK
ncbi:MAG: PaaI family thioesterase [Promethearchaeota archaeon]|jgi:acyl-CoA thioesterase